jgi:hypothetical protein
MWNVVTTDIFDAWFAELDSSAKEEIGAKIGLLKVVGPQLGRPHADTLKGSKHKNMKELRADTNDMVMRIAFAFDPNRRAILLVAGDKGGVSERLFYKQLIAKADALFDGHLAELKQKVHDSELKKKKEK